jgi:hypothetical protein
VTAANTARENATTTMGNNYPLSFRISESNDALACFDASIDANA